MRTAIDQLYQDIWQQIFEEFNAIEMFFSLMHITREADEVLFNINYHLYLRGLLLDVHLRTSRKNFAQSSHFARTTSKPLSCQYSSSVKLESWIQLKKCPSIEQVSSIWSHFNSTFQVSSVVIVCQQKVKKHFIINVFQKTWPKVFRVLGVRICRSFN